MGALLLETTGVVGEVLDTLRRRGDRQARVDEFFEEWRHNEASWQEAFESWLDAKEAKTGSRNTRRVYEASVKAFFEFAGVHPWVVSGVHVNGWQRELRKQGNSETTINLRLSALSSFFSYCVDRFVLADPVSGNEYALAERNPVRRAERSKIDPYEKAVFLNAEEVRALLRAVDQTTAVGLRDYALLVTYVYTGRRSSEVRRLRWGDISREQGRYFYRWTGKGGVHRTDELPAPAYQAMAAYLKAAGRWETLTPDTYVFTALSDVATRLPNVTEYQAQPLSSAMVNRIVKKWARRAGLQWERIHTHTLRHTAAMLRRRLTDDLGKIQDFLAHSQLSTTQIYIQHAAKREDNLWAGVEALIGLG